jgi:hypothetical protein
MIRQNTFSKYNWDLYHRFWSKICQKGKTCSGKEHFKLFLLTHALEWLTWENIVSRFTWKTFYSLAQKLPITRPQKIFICTCQSEVAT